MFKLIISALVLGCWILGAGCARSVSFRPTAAHLEYWVEEEVEPRSFRIYYQGGSPASDERITDFALLRACHVAEAADCKYFAVVDELRSSAERRIFDSEVDSLALQRNIRLVIQCFPSRPKNVFVFHAKAMEAALRQKYRAGDRKAHS